MNLKALLPFLVFLITASAWLFRIRHRRLMEPEVILGQLYPHETDAIERFATVEGVDFLSEDRDFWKASRGWAGQRRRRHNATCLVQFCQRLDLSSQVEKAELRIMTARAMLIAFYGLASVFEAILRWYLKDLPHSCARTAAQLYWDMERRATTLCGLYRPDLLGQLHQIL